MSGDSYGSFEYLLVIHSRASDQAADSDADLSLMNITGIAVGIESINTEPSFWSLQSGLALAATQLISPVSEVVQIPPLLPSTTVSFVSTVVGNGARFMLHLLFKNSSNMAKMPDVVAERLWKRQENPVYMDNI